MANINFSRQMGREEIAKLNARANERITSDHNHTTVFVDYDAPLHWSGRVSGHPIVMIDRWGANISFRNDKDLAELAAERDFTVEPI